MANTNPLLDDLAGLMTGAMGAAKAAGDEARTAMQARVRSLIADMDLADRGGPRHRRQRAGTGRGAGKTRRSPRSQIGSFSQAHRQGERS